MNDYFHFKQFTIHQEKTAMKVGTDGVLLGAWADLKDSRFILDIGTGTGLIALMAAQRQMSAEIDAVEINKDAYEQAVQNVNISPWSSRIHLYPISLFDFQPGHSYDHILCNPPFFLQSTPAPDRNRTIARHCKELEHTDLLAFARRFLTEKGKLGLILPVKEAEELIRKAENYTLFLTRLLQVHPTPSKAVKRYLMEFSRQNAPLQHRKLIVEYERHHYSKEYQELTRDFYLNF